MENESLRTTYTTLKKEWEDVSSFMGLGAADLPEFKAIVDLGPEIIPFIIADICQQQTWIVRALFVLTQERPSKQYQPGI